MFAQGSSGINPGGLEGLQTEVVRESPGDKISAQRKGPEVPSVFRPFVLFVEKGGWLKRALLLQGDAFAHVMKLFLDVAVHAADFRFQALEAALCAVVEIGASVDHEDVGIP